jgi:signal peptidase II
VIGRAARDVAGSGAPAVPVAGRRSAGRRRGPHLLLSILVAAGIAAAVVGRPRATATMGAAGRRRSPVRTRGHRAATGSVGSAGSVGTVPSGMTAGTRDGGDVSDEDGGPVRDPDRPAVDDGPATAGRADDRRVAVRRARRRVVVSLLIAMGLVAADQATKELALARLAPGRFVSLIGPDVGWQLVFNPGGAFGLPAPHWVFLVVTVVVVVLVVRAVPSVPSLLQAASYGMLLAGALGNAIDRVTRPGDPSIAFGGGYVVDFVAWGTFPRFNVADASITVGFVLLLVALWRDEQAPFTDESADGE